MQSMPLRVIDKDFNLIVEINKYSSLQMTRSWFGIGKLELRINRFLKGADDLIRGRILFPHNHLDKAYIIRHKEIELDEDGDDTDNWIIIAEHIKSWLEQRIIIPPIGKSHESLSSNAESVMLNLINKNAISPVDHKRKMNNLRLGNNLQRGMELDWKSRYKSLAEELGSIGAISKLGWNIELDLDNKSFIVKVLEGKNLSAYQTENNPAIFSPEFKTLKRMSYVESELDYKNTSYVAGQGKGIDRRVIELGESEGFERYELFVDARDIEEEIEQEEGEPIPRSADDIERDLETRGNQKLIEREQTIYLEGEYSTNKNIAYREDWDLGDIVTIQNKDWDVTIDSQITEVKEIYEGGNISIEPVFGGDRPSLISKIKQELSQIDSEITR